MRDGIRRLEKSSQFFLLHVDQGVTRISDPTDKKLEANSYFKATLKRLCTVLPNTQNMAADLNLISAMKIMF